MALPKRKHTQARRDKRRSHLTPHLVSLTRCPQCANSILPHHVCPQCGFYRRRQILEVAKDKKKESPA